MNTKSGKNLKGCISILLSVMFLLLTLQVPTYAAESTLRVIILSDTNQTQGKYPVLEECAQDPKMLDLINNSFIRTTLEHYKDSQKYSKLTNEPFYLVFKENSGCYAKMGFYIRKDGVLTNKTNIPYIEMRAKDLTEDPAKFDSITQILPHEMGHVLTMLACGDYTFTKELENMEMHYSDVITDYSTAFYDIYITDSNGTVLLKPLNSQVAQLYMESLKKTNPVDNAISKRTIRARNTLLYNELEKLDNRRYVIISRLLLRNDEVKLMYLGLIVFLLIFFMLSYRKVGYIKKLSDGLKHVATGNLNYKARIKGHDELSALAENINNMVYELRERKTREENAEKTKNELITNVSHDLKTPLTSIIGYIQLIKEGYNGNDDLNKYISIIDEKSQRLKVLIEDLFEYTMLSSGEMKLKKEDVSLNELLRQVIEGLMPICTQHGVSINYCAPDNEIMSYVDPAKLARVFENIIQNAAKYSCKPGEIDIKLFIDNGGPVTGIFNKGKTLDEEELFRLFDRFYRTDEARNSNTGGAGLGLSIAKSIVELHDGRIWAENSKDGIWFYVKF